MGTGSCDIGRIGGLLVLGFVGALAMAGGTAYGVMTNTPVTTPPTAVALVDRSHGCLPAPPAPPVRTPVATAPAQPAVAPLWRVELSR